jgi:integrase
MTRRANNEGSVYRDRGRGDWIAAVTFEGPDGKRRRRRRRAPTQRAAQRLRREMLQEIETRGADAGSRGQTLAAYLDDWLRDVVTPTLRPTTTEAYSYQVRKHISPVIGHIDLRKLSPQHIQHLFTHQQSLGLSPATIQQTRRTLRRALEQAVEWDVITVNPAARVRGPKMEHRHRSILRPEQATALLDQVRGHRLEALYSLSLSLGLRQGEALGLRWSDLELDAGMLHVRQQLQSIRGRISFGEPKTERSRRTLALPRLVIDALRAHRARQLEERLQLGSTWEDHGLVFCSEVGTPLTPRNLTRHFKRQLDLAGLPDVRWHDLRHTAASFLALQGVHPRVAMQVLGHSTSAMTTEVYTHVLEEQQRDAASRIDELLGS